jgi:hypothetical protein
MASIRRVTVQLYYSRLSLLRYWWDKGDVSDYRYNQYKLCCLVRVRIQDLYRNKQYFAITDIVL